MGCGGSRPIADVGLPGERHTKAVLAIACFTLPDGSPRALSGGYDTTLKLWDPLAGTCLATFEGHTYTVKAIACFTLPDGSPRALSASDDTTLKLWDPLAVTSTPCLLTVTGLRVKAIACFTLPDGSPRALTGGEYFTLQLWDPLTGSCLATIKNALSFYTTVQAIACFTLPNGSPRALTGGYDTPQLWDPLAGTCLATLKGHTWSVNAVACFTLPDGSPRALSGARDGIKLWNPLAGMCLATLKGHESEVTAIVCFTLPDGSPRALSGAEYSNRVKLWDPLAGTCLATFKGHKSYATAIACFTLPDGSPRALSGGGHEFGDGDKALKLWDPRTASDKLIKKQEVVGTMDIIGGVQDEIRRTEEKLRRLKGNLQSAQKEFEEQQRDLLNTAKAAKTVHLISTPFLSAPAGMRKAAEEKKKLHNPPAVVAFDPNSDIATVGNLKGWSKEEQEKKWLEVFNKIMLICKQKKPEGSTVRVMCNMRKPADPMNAGKPELMGNAQPGELLAALGFGFTEEDGSLVYVIYKQ